MQIIRLKHYSTKEINDNWDVFLYGIKIGQIRDREGIGGELGKWTETDLWDIVCELAEKELVVLKKFKFFHIGG